jgi:hypothetical protein
VKRENINKLKMKKSIALKIWLERKILATAWLILLSILFSSCTSKEPFNLVLLPDTQIYAMRYPEVFVAQTQWIVENADSIAFVLHQGDITHNNNDEEWKNAVAALYLMDNRVPYTFVAGNHDLGPGGSGRTRDSELLNQYLPYEKYRKMDGFGGAFEPGKMDNTWHTFKAGGLNWLILSLEFGPRDKVLKWAGEVIAKHPRHKVIINTHAYMYSDNNRMSPSREHKWVPQGYGVGKATGEDATNDGEMMWEKLVSQYPNVLLVFSGHVLNSGVGRLESVGVHGNTVYQILANYQMGEKGGNGFLRVLKVDPKKNEISIKTYSPYLNEYRTDSDHQFVLENVRF